MNFFQSLAADLNGHLASIGQQELNVVGTALGNVIPAALSNPTKAGLIAAAAPALVKIAAVQPMLIFELLTDLMAAIARMEVAAEVGAQVPPKL
jgi:hypothetical protein